MEEEDEEDNVHDLEVDNHIVAYDPPEVVHAADAMVVANVSLGAADAAVVADVSLGAVDAAAVADVNLGAVGADVVADVNLGAVDVPPLVGGQSESPMFSV